MSLRWEKLFVSLGVQSIIAVVFFWIERVTESGPVPVPAWLITPLDDAIPLVPWTVWAYVSWYAIPVVLLMLDREGFRRAAVAVLLGFGLCAVGYVLLPVSMERPTVVGDGPSAILLRAVYAIDHPRNILPSFHATICVILLRVAPGAPVYRLALGAWMAAICCSCVSTTQHYALDVFAGLTVGLMAVSTVDAVKRWARRSAPVPVSTAARFSLNADVRD